jgi:hypothetical protein
MTSSPLLLPPSVVSANDDATTLVDSPLEYVDDYSISNDRAYDCDDDAETLVEMTLEQSIRTDAKLMKRLQHLLGMKRVSWLTLARMMAIFTRFSRDLLDDTDFKDFLLMSIVAVKSCSHSYAKNGYKTFHTYYTKLVCEDLPRDVEVTAGVYKLSLENACLRVLDFARERFEYEWKRDHCKVCP